MANNCTQLTNRHEEFLYFLHKLKNFTFVTLFDYKIKELLTPLKQYYAVQKALEQQSTLNLEFVNTDQQQPS